MLSLPAKHAMKALLVLAKGTRGEFTSVSVLAKAAGVPSPYLSKLMKQLATAGLVTTRKGPSGGVALPKKMISLYDVCKALGDPIITDTCLLSKKACSVKSPCQLHSKWSKERKRMHGFLQKVHV